MSEAETRVPLDAQQAQIASLEAQLATLGQSHTAALAECERLRHERVEDPRAEQERRQQELHTLLKQLSAQLFALSDVDGCGLYLLDSSETALVTAELRLREDWAAICKAYTGFRHQLLQPDVNVKVVRRGEVLLVNEENHADFGDTTRMRFRNMNMRSLLAAPLTLTTEDGANKIIGVVSVFSSSTELDPALATQIAALANPLLPQLARLWSHNQIIEWGKAVQVMYSEIQQHIAFITEMNSATDPEEVYALIGARFIERFGLDLVGILLAENDELTIAHTSFSPPYRHLAPAYEAFRRETRYSLQVPDGSSPIVFANNHRFLFDDVQQIVHLPMTDKDRRSLDLLPGLRTFLLVPIRFQNAPTGVLWLGSLAAPLSFADSDLTLVELLASYISTAIRNAKAHNLIERQKQEIEALNRDLQDKVQLLGQQARRDKLTGLHNFGSFEDELRRRTQESQRHPDTCPLSAIMLDVDHFKRLNDSFGHPAGNEILQEVATRILKSVRDIDFVARYGGEEFAILLPHCTQEEAGQIAERIRRKMADNGFVVASQEHQVSISGGCTQFDPRESAHAFIRRADAALYSAKQNGRNRIVASSPV